MVKPLGEIRREVRARMAKKKAALKKRMEAKKAAIRKRLKGDEA